MRPCCVLLAVVLGTSAARAAPVVAVTIGADQLRDLASRLHQTDDEPAGLEARVDIPALGLRAGDVIYAIDGKSMSNTIDDFTQPIFYLDVWRGTKPLVVRVAVRATDREVTLDRDDYTTQVDQMQRGGRLVQLRRDHAASGVLVPGNMFLTSPVPSEVTRDGDVIRAIDGRPTPTIASLFDALGRAADHDSVAIQLERGGAPFTVRLHLRGAATGAPRP
ncbi:MAG TPA: hypothetical protein VLX92_11540 [Kofleriaceae bacterium]|nr:hypothetical protein [Kofleriaceae bacterium]